MKRIKGSRSAMEAATCRLGAALFLLSFLFVCGASAESPAPASQAQLQELSRQISEKQALRETKNGEMGEMGAVGAAEILKIDAMSAALAAVENSPTFLRHKAIEKYLQQAEGVKPEYASGLVGFFDPKGEKAKLQKKREEAVKRRDAEVNRIANEITNLDTEIAQLQATLNYSKDPLAADLENERARQRILKNQKPTSDDQGQLGREIEDIDARIIKLEREYKESQPGSQTTTSSQSVQPQGSYLTPSTGIGVSPGSSAQSPGHSGYAGPDTGSPQVPYGPILEGIQGSIGDKAGGKPKHG